MSHSICGIDTRFKITTKSELVRFRSLRGEEEIISDIIHEIDSDNIFYDVGANVGMYSCTVGQVLPDNHVIAFEPHPENIRNLKKNLDINNISALTFEYALSDTKGKGDLSIDINEAGAGEHSLKQNEHTDDSNMSVSLITGDECVAVNNLPQPDILKIDVEGAEMDVLKGFENTLSSSSCNILYVEIHPNKLGDFGYSTEDITDLLQHHGYTIEYLKKRDSEKFVKAKE